jgi:hypothetical protein
LLIVNCKNCGIGIKTFPSRAWRTNYCSDKCRDNVKENIIKSRERNCQNCGSIFVPRKYQIDSKVGKYCSAKCKNQSTVKILCTKENRTKALRTYLKNLSAGFISHKSGEDHPRWKGGQKELVKRRIESGKAKESVKKYRSKNPEKVREWTQTRSRRKYGRLPRGTVISKRTRV